MKLHLTQSEGNNLITAYTEDYIDINRQRYTSSLIVMADAIITDWGTPLTAPLTLELLTEREFDKVASLKPELVLLGTGKNHQFLHPRVYQPLPQQGIMVECMATSAACRTYNILMSEGRNVAAMLLL